MKDSTLLIVIFLICSTVGLISWLIYDYNIKETRFYAENGYEERCIVGSGTTHWVKVNKDGKYIDIDNKLVETK